MAKKTSKTKNNASSKGTAGKSAVVTDGPAAAGGDSGSGAGPSARPGPYVVLARKYRPQTFDDLIGQQAMITTLRNAFASDRIAQGYMLTGVRGVGKTTTARILARALNYSLPEGTEGGPVTRPTIDMPILGEHCAQIMESRHADVLELDAASNTGIDNIREIIESARYKPMLARYKVYIIDEVHMLSKGAFNALLKTLEEPPGHVKFIFATTEIRKVPVTVLSRCQRFDLRRVDVPTLTAHFQMICSKEGAEADEEALAMIARAAGGSVRDGLSILDQAIATSLGSPSGEDGRAAPGSVNKASVGAMLGLADGGRVFDLLDHLFGGKAGKALQSFGQLHHDGAEAGQVLGDLAERVHAIARLKTVGSQAAAEALSAEEKRRAAALADRLSMALLSRAWQMLLKGIEEVAKAPNPLAAAEMVLIRLAYTADLPTPDEIIKLLGNGDRAVPAGTARPAAQTTGAKAATSQPRCDPAGGTPQAVSSSSAASAFSSSSPPTTATDSATVPTVPPADGLLPPPWERDEAPPAMHRDMAPDMAPATSAAAAATAASTGPSAMPMPQSFEAVVALAGQHRDVKLVYDLEENVSLIRFEPGKIDLCLLPDASPELANELREKLNRWTGRNWILALSSRRGAAPLGEAKRKRRDSEIDALREHPAVKAVFEAFPEAEIRQVRPVATAAKQKNDKAAG